jgi:hypothetical protein
VVEDSLSRRWMGRMGKTYTVNPIDYKLLEEVGYGASAVVYRAIYIPFNEVVAIKCLDLDRCNINLVRVLFFLLSWLIFYLIFLVIWSDFYCDFRSDRVWFDRIVNCLVFLALNELLLSRYSQQRSGLIEILSDNWVHSCDCDCFWIWFMIFLLI